jgi:hypothetical protein
VNAYRWATIGTLLIAAAWAGAEENAKKKGDARAASLMEEAAKTRYVWSADVTGVSGEFTWSKDGKTGSATFHDVFHQDDGLKITGQGGSEVPEEIHDHVASMINHRVPPGPAAAKRPRPDAVILVEDDERGPLVMIVGDAMHSTQRIKDGKLVQVNRRMGGQRFTIDVTEFENVPDGRVYPKAFTVTWWDAGTGKRTERQTYTTEGLDVIDGQMFPKAEKVASEKDGQTSTTEISYSNIKFETNRR